jgi:hypothetical protein
MERIRIIGNFIHTGATRGCSVRTASVPGPAEDTAFTLDSNGEVWVSLEGWRMSKLGYEPWVVRFAWSLYMWWP